MTTHKINPLWGLIYDQERPKGQTGNKSSIDYILSDVEFIKVINKILDKLIDEENNKELSSKQYEAQSWPFAQADRNGAKRAYNNIKRLFNDR